MMAGAAEEEVREVRERAARSGADFRVGRWKSFPAESRRLPPREDGEGLGAVALVALVFERELDPSPA